MAGINRQPPGLRDLVQIQAGGRNPDELIETVRPILDLEQYYDVERYQVAQEPLSMTTGQLEFVEVPAGELWKVKAITARNMVAVGQIAGDVKRIAFEVERITPLGFNGISLATSPDLLVSAAAVEFASFSFWPPSPLLVRAGQRVVIRCEVNTTSPTAFTGELQVLYTRLEV